MTLLPSTVEAYLLESGLSPTEIMVMKKLLEGPALTLRELAAKTGKGSNVLDRAIKKLLRRGILSKETVNDSQKFTVQSLDSIQKWMKSDMDLKRKMLEQKEQDFDSFISALKLDQGRPEIEHFDGEEGLIKAYRKLLTLTEKELLFYVPVKGKEEDDLLRAFRVQYFRERHKNGIFSRVIAPNTPLGRRYQSRDAFEYRKTILVDPEHFPVAFEKVIAGDTIACFNHAEKSASFIHYPEMAQSENAMFEMVWRRGVKEGGGEDKVEVEEEVGLKTKVVAGVRELFLSRKALSYLTLFGFIALISTYGMYQYTLHLMKDEVGQRLMSIASTAAPEFDTDDLNVLRIAKDMESDEYQSVFSKLNDIRDRNEGILWIYIMRKTDVKNIWEFVADADTNYDLPIYVEWNNDGVLDEADEGAPPGTRYDGTGQKINDGGLKIPMFEDEFVVDQWGIYLTASSPIFDDDGNGIAILGLDMDVTDFYSMINNKFSTIIWFFAVFVTLIFVRFITIIAHRRSTGTKSKT